MHKDDKDSAIYLLTEMEDGSRHQNVFLT